MCLNYKNRGHRPASAGSSHFIGWKKKQLWSAQEGGKRPGREEGSWAGARHASSGKTRSFHTQLDEVRETP